MVDQSFVFEGTEVILTGRTAIREIKKANGSVVACMTLVEIKPFDKDIEWSKWIDPKLLFIVQ